ncbi:glycoside hydrolase [Paenibacillus sambharensis]|uniref:Glycoside hydrolase n=1 Tax=Paenibacillus sambharensis TaxID=1803190 RepID=A0A2W1L1H0_9BACL|nr:glycoside hydrolase family 43 protein [Paenibacillus sambharensis]PZD93216.1 glycoside hydrolase [Paenibacillus sambharensis]
MKPLSLSEINLRDPFILTDERTGAYYLYGTDGATAWSGKPTGFDVYISRDLVSWEGPEPAFRPDEDFWSDRHYWAPEVHQWNGRCYMFASFKSEQQTRGTSILVSDSPVGPFIPLFGGKPVTPDGWECLDGTLHADDEGQPWMVFCREWVEVKDGEMYAVRLSPDLSRADGDPILLFKASDAPWAVAVGDNKDSYITDGPYMHRLPDGELVMLWSSAGEQGYTMGLARSSGGIEGPWTQDAQPVFAKDGGHGMLFRTFEGELCLTIHIPNANPQERPVIFKVKEEGSRLVIEGQAGQ